MINWYLLVSISKSNLERSAIIAISIDWYQIELVHCFNKRDLSVG